MMNIQNRLQKLRQQLALKKVEALLVSQPDNLFYLSGCEGLEGFLLITPGENILVTDFRYIEQAQRQSPDYRIFRIEGKMAAWLPNLIKDLGLHSLGFESQHLNYFSYQQIVKILETAEPKLETVPLDSLVESLRQVKEAEEIERMSEAARIADAAILHAEKVLHSGMTELELAWQIEKFMRENGSQPVPFELIVAAGPNSALPHAKPSGYRIEAGEPIVIDIGAKSRWYGSDITRTLYFGKPTDTFKKVYSTVLHAQQRAIAGIQAGMTGKQADLLARQVITEAGYGDSFGHSLGHGLGLVTHEKPGVGPGSDDLLTEGMVFSIEPGIYLSGWGGVRIEDDALIDNGKIRLITAAPKYNL
jgi:Xaa-Pro aminopeptidase